MIFEDLNLTASIKKSLDFYSSNNSFPNTILVEGGEREKRILLARLIGKAILCEGEEKPCGKCHSCIKFNIFSHPDVKEYGDEEGNAIFKVELCREIRHTAFIIPNDGDRKLYVLKEAQNMNESAENALLKIFEEPPSYVYFIMTCDSRSAMLDTILSRATVISLSDEDGISFSDKTEEIAEAFVLALCESNELSLISKTGVLEKDKDEFLRVLDCLSVILKDAMMKKSKAHSSQKFKKSVDYLCDKLPIQRIFDLQNVIKDLENSCKMNSNYNLTLTRMCYEFRRAINR